MKDYGCGAMMSDGMPCSTADNVPPMLCDVCLRKLIQLLEAYERVADDALFVDGKLYRLASDEEAAEFIWGEDRINAANLAAGSRAADEEMEK